MAFLRSDANVNIHLSCWCLVCWLLTSKKIEYSQDPKRSDVLLLLPWPWYRDVVLLKAQNPQIFYNKNLYNIILLKSVNLCWLILWFPRLMSDEEELGRAICWFLQSLMTCKWSPSNSRDVKTTTFLCKFSHGRKSMQDFNPTQLSLFCSCTSASSTSNQVTMYLRSL